MSYQRSVIKSFGGSKAAMRRIEKLKRQLRDHGFAGLAEVKNEYNVQTGKYYVSIIWFCDA
jgi:hypothetical protein